MDSELSVEAAEHKNGREPGRTDKEGREPSGWRCMPLHGPVTKDKGLNGSWIARMDHGTLTWAGISAGQAGDEAGDTDIERLRSGSGR